MSAFKKGLAVILATFFILSALGALLAFNLERTAFDPETYRQALANQQFYDLLPGIMAEGLAASIPPESLPSAMQGLSAEQWERLVRDLLPPETLQGMGDQALGSLFAYLEGQADTAQVSLAPLKQSMAGERGVQAALNALRAQPDCTLAQLAQMTMAAFTDSQAMLCNPPEELYPIITPFIQGQLQVAAAALPDQIILFGGQPGGFQGSARQRLQTIRLAMRLSPLLPLAFLFALTILVVRRLRDWLAWWGIPFSITGALAVVTGLLGAPLAGRLVAQTLARRLPASLPSFVLDNSGQLTAAMLGRLLEPVTMQGLILMGVGLAMTVLAMLVKPSAPPDARMKKA
ncbi:MAG: hypothetical protein ACOYYJ_07025 [Chloroflexota bacterium]